MDKNDDPYSVQEANQRFQAALKGARIAGHKPMESLIKRASKVRPKKKARKPSKTRT